MFGSLKFAKQLNTDQLYEQLSASKGVTGKARAFVAEYLVALEIDSLDIVTVPDLLRYRRYVRTTTMKNAQKAYYENLLEQEVFAYLILHNPLLAEDAKEVIKSRAVRNKTIGFLLVSGRQSFDEIDYELRTLYQEYLAETLSAKVAEYVKSMDRLKLAAIKRQNKDQSFITPKLKYENKTVFLLYHPSYQVAKSFYYVQDKEELLFDFSIETSAILKRQIFQMLNHVIESKENRHDRRERYLIPLKMFYEYCIQNEIDDVEQISEKQIKGFQKNIEGTVGTKTATYMQLIDNIRKHLFLEAEHTNWTANAWYMERFSFEEGRMNPSREIKRFTFGQVENEKNRALFKAYMKYQIGISQKSSIQTIRGQYYAILSFLRFLDVKDISATSVSAKEMEAYINLLDENGNQPEGFNRVLIAIARFYGYLRIIKEIPKIPICFDYYFKKTFPRHNDRAVSEDSQREILQHLKEIPEHLRLMYLNLWCVGLRINEVCAIKGGAYCWDKRDAWIRIYQSKMKSEKNVPIPTVLYQAMAKYIDEHNIGADEFVFKKKSGGAYDAGTFCKQFKYWLKKVGVKNYDFRSHDFRHTVGTSLYANGASIEVIRDYLGHKDSDMTKQYLDYMPTIIDAANEEYFASRTSKLANISAKIEEKKWQKKSI